MRGWAGRGWGREVWEVQACFFCGGEALEYASAGIRGCDSAWRRPQILVCAIALYGDCRITKSLMMRFPELSLVCHHTQL